MAVYVPSVHTTLDSRHFGHLSRSQNEEMEAGEAAQSAHCSLPKRKDPSSDPRSYIKPSQARPHAVPASGGAVGGS